MKKNRVEEVVFAIEQILSGDPPGFAPGVSGYSGQRLVHLLGTLAGRGGGKRGCYVEVGVYRGLTLASVGYAAPDKNVYGIDNFRVFDPQGENQRVAETHLARLGLNRARIINKDYEDALASLSENIGDEKIDCYFVDGPHDYRSQLMCLSAVRPYLHDDAVIVVDDCNYEHVRQATQDFLTAFPEYRLVFDAYTECHPYNMNEADRERAAKGWWNGVHVLLRDDDGVLPKLTVPTQRSRRVFENEHTIHSARYPAAALSGLQLAEAWDAFMHRRPGYSARMLKRAASGVLKCLRKDAETRGEFPGMNTRSRGLEKARLAK